MAKDEQILIRMNNRTKESIEDFAEEYEYNTSEAARKMIKGRLAAEGYLEGATVVDGGRPESMDEQVEDIQENVAATQSQVEATQSQVGVLKEEITQLKNTVGPALLLCLVYIGAEVSVGIPGGPAVVAGTGIACLAYLLYSYSKVAGYV